MIVTYLDIETNNKLIASFDTSSLYKPDGICIFKGSNGTRIEGEYKSGELFGEWTERGKYNIIIKKVNYDYKRVNISRDRLNFQVNIQSDNECFVHVADMPSFKNRDVSYIITYFKDNIFLPASYRFFHKSNKEVKIFVQFEIIDHEKIANVRCMGRYKNDDLESDAKRLVYSTQGLWSNNMHRGKPSDVTFTYPINFTIY